MDICIISALGSYEKGCYEHLCTSSSVDICFSVLWGVNLGGKSLSLWQTPCFSHAALQTLSERGLWAFGRLGEQAEPGLEITQTQVWILSPQVSSQG